jgi:hypothetical protein
MDWMHPPDESEAMTTDDTIADDAVFTMKEAAALCRMSVQTLHKHRKRGDLLVMVFGRRLYRVEGRAIKAFRWRLTKEVRKPCQFSEHRGPGSTDTTSRSSTRASGSVRDFLKARAQKTRRKPDAAKPR